MAETVPIEGLVELKATLLELPNKLQKSAINKALRQAANVIRDDARMRAPVLRKPDPRRRAGTLKKAIQTKKERGSRDLVLFTVGIRRLSEVRKAAFRARMAKKGKRARGGDNPNDPFYARFVEMGTSKMAAQPFLQPALNAKTQAALGRFTGALREWLSVEANIRH